MNNEKLEKELNVLVKKATDFRASQRDNEYITNRAHYEGLQWNLAENKVDSPFLLKSDINHLKNAIDLRLGSLCSDKYWGELKPLSPDDVQNIEKLNILYKNEWDRLNADDVVEDVIKNGAICDNGYVLINFDVDKIQGSTNTRSEGAITLKVLDTANVYLDPSADSIEECEFYVVKARKTLNWIKINKPDWLKVIKENDLKPGVVNSSEEGNIYKGRDYSSEQDDLFEINTVYRKEAVETEIKNVDEITGIEEIEKVKGSIVKEYYLINKHLVGTNENYPFNDFPVIPFQWEPEPQSPYGIPLLRGLTVPQKVANLIESAANNIAMHYTVPTYLVSEDSGIDIKKFAKLNRALGMAWKVSGDASSAVKQLDPPQINADLISIKENFVQNIRSYAGVTDVYVGSVGTAGSTSEGTTLAINRATIIDNAPTKQIQKFVEQLTKMIIKFMVRYYKGRTVYVRDTSKLKNQYQFQEIQVDDKLENMNYEFTVDLASRSKTDKNRQYNLMKELYTVQNQYKEDKKIINVADLVKAAQLDNYDEMFKRLSDMSEEAFAEKADLIVQIMQIGQVMTPNGTSLITPEEMQQGIMDVLDDNGDLSTVESIFNTYEEYQTQITELKNNIQAQEQQSEINDLSNAQQSQSQLIDQLIAGRQNLMTPSQNIENIQ
jgi:hypothetical protein